MNQYYQVPGLRLYHLSRTFAKYEKRLAFMKSLAIEDIKDSGKQTILISKEVLYKTNFRGMGWCRLMKKQ
jgi:hypothetical protein